MDHDDENVKGMKCSLFLAELGLVISLSDNFRFEPNVE